MLLAPVDAEVVGSGAELCAVGVGILAMATDDDHKLGCCHLTAVKGQLHLCRRENKGDGCAASNRQMGRERFMT